MFDIITFGAGTWDIFLRPKQSQKINDKKKFITGKGICGEAPSNYPEFAEFLVEQGIESMSLNPSVVLKTHLIVAEKEKNLKKENN